MKKWFFTAAAALLLCLVCLLPEGALAAETVQSGSCGTNLRWTLDSDGVLTVSGSGAMNDYTAAAPGWKGSTVNKLVLTEGVTSVGAHAFDGCGIPFVQLPDSLRTVGEAAFRGNRFVEVRIPDSVTAMGSDVFRDCAQLEAVRFTAGMDAVPAGTFAGCSAMKLVILPGSVRTVEADAFAGCTALEAVYWLGELADLGTLTIGSGNAALENAQAYLALAVTQQPTDATTSVGGRSAVFTAAGSRSGLTYQWQYLDKNGSWANILDLEGCRSASLTVPAKAAYDGYTVRCVMVDAYEATVASDSAVLTVLPAPTVAPLPDRVLVGQGQEARVTLETTGEGLTYQWYFANYGKTQFALTTSYDGPAYYLEMTAARAGRRIYCVVTDQYGSSVQSETVLLAMKSNLTITTQPKDAAAIAGAEAAVTLRASGDELSYAWYFAAAGSDVFVRTGTFTSNEYAVDMTAARDGRRVYCVVSDRYGNSVQSDTVTLSLIPAPRITVQPTDVYGDEGETVTVTFTAEGEELTYRWYYANAGSSAFQLTESFTTNSYSVEMSESRDGRRIYCVVTDKYGQSVRTDKVTLCMAAKPLAIVTQPVDAYASEGEMATVTFTAQGEELTYKWYYAEKGSSTFKLTTSFTTNTYSVAMTEARAGRRIYCVVTDKYGASVTTDTVTLHRQQADLALVTQPTDGYAKAGETATVSFSARGEGLKYAWYYADKGSDTFKLTTSFTSNSYSVAMTEARDGRRIYCVVTDKYGASVTTDTVTLHLSLPTLTVVTQPTDAVAAEGQMATVTVAASGDGLKYAWYYADKGSDTFKLTTSFTSNTYSVAMTAARDGRRIYCVITDAHGQSVTTDTVTLSVAQPPRIVTQPQNVVTPAGTDAVVSFTAAGDGLTYKWYFANADSSTFAPTTAFTGPEYSVKMTAERSGRRIYCVVTDKYGQSVTTDTVKLTMGSRLTVTQQPKSVTAASGSKATVTVKASGDGLKYAWYFADAGRDEFALTTSFTSNTYSVTMTAARDGRRVYCVITDKYGQSVRSDTATLSVIQPPVITRQPVDVQGAAGETVTVSFTAEGEGLRYTWYYANKGASTFTKTSSFTGPEYTVEMSASRAGRRVYCVVTDQYGQSVRTNTVTLGYESGLAIVTQPTDAYAASGAKATVTFTAEGEGLTYKWYFADAGKDAFALTTSFTSNTYSVTMTAARSGRRIYCVVTDKYGNSVTTDTVTLTMGSRLAITQQPKSVTVASGSKATVTVKASGEGLKYAWYFADKGISEFALTTSFTSNTYSVTMNAGRDGRRVFCVITDKNGNSVTTEVATLQMK